MKRRLFTLIAMMSMVVGMMAGTASAKVTEPGEPGTPNCKGQTTAFLAQAGKELGAPGLGNLADLAGLSVQEVHEIVDMYCAAP